MGRNFPAADETGASDPFVIARCMGKKVKSKVKYETLNPGWFEILEMKISIPPVDDKNYPKPGISILCYDDDQGLFGSKKDLLGRVWIELETNNQMIESPLDKTRVPTYMHKKKAWYDLIFDATNSKEG